MGDRDSSEPPETPLDLPLLNIIISVEIRIITFLTLYLLGVTYINCLQIVGTRSGHSVSPDLDLTQIEFLEVLLFCC